MHVENMKGITMALFPVPVHYDFDSEYRLSDKEWECLSKIECVRSAFNTNNLSDNSSILEEQDLVGIKNHLKKYLDHYVKDILRIKNNFALTNSWVSRNKPGDSHPGHTHPHSIISGVFYAKAGKNSGNLNFSIGKTAIQKDYRFLYDYEDYNLFNSANWFLEVATGTVIIFPSCLQHHVDVNKSDEERVVIGFNSFVDDSIGSPKIYTDLTLKVN